MRLAVIVLLLALLGTGLYITKPDTEQFAAHHARSASPEVLAQLGLSTSGALGSVVQNLAEGVIRAALEERTRDDDYLVARVFTVPLPGEDWRVLGIAGQFFTLSGP